MAEKSSNPLPAALFPRGADGKIIFRSAASRDDDRPPIPAPAATPTDFADEVSRIFHKAKRKALGVAD